jgi:hypothetical protein
MLRPIFPVSSVCGFSGSRERMERLTSGQQGDGEF